MKLIKAETLNTGVNFHDVTDVFSADYKEYTIVVSGLVGNESTATGANCRLLKASDDSAETGTVYEYGIYSLKAETSNSVSRSQNDTRWFNTFGGVDDGAQAGGGVLNLFCPFDSHNTFAMWNGTNHAGGPNFRSYWGKGVIINTTSYSGIRVDLNETAARIGGGVISIYGVC